MLYNKYNKETIINIIKDLREESKYDFPFDYYDITKDFFLYLSYWSSGFEEIIRYVNDSKKEDPIDALKDFKEMISDFSNKNNFNAMVMLSIYYDLIEYILDFLLFENI